MTENDVNPPINNDPMEKRNELFDHPSYVCIENPSQVAGFFSYLKPEDHWSYIAHLSAEDMLKSAVIEEKKFKHSPWAGADNPFGPKF